MAENEPGTLASSPEALFFYSFLTGEWHLVDVFPAIGKLGDQFGFNPIAVLPDDDVLDGRSSKSFYGTLKTA